MESFGEYLKRERQLRNVSLEEVSKVTRISKGFLQAIESDQFENLPGKAFVKGFLRSYCRIVGLDPEEVILRFESSLEPKPTIPPPTIKRYGTFPPLFVIGVPLVVVVFGGLIFFVFRKGEGKHMRHTESVQHEVISPGESSSEQLIHTRVPSSVGIPQGPSGAAQARQISVTSSKGLVLKAIASKETWIMIRADDGQAIEATLKADEEYVWKAKGKLSLRVGNAGGVSLTLNDKPLGPLGPEGKVVGIVFTAP